MEYFCVADLNLLVFEPLGMIESGIMNNEINKIDNSFLQNYWKKGNKGQYNYDTIPESWASSTDVKNPFFFRLELTRMTPS